MMCANATVSNITRGYWEDSLEQRASDEPSVLLPLGLNRIPNKLRNPFEVVKLHLKHYRMSVSQFRKRTSALKVPEDIYQEYETFERTVTHVRSRSQSRPILE